MLKRIRWKLVIDFIDITCNFLVTSCLFYFRFETTFFTSATSSTNARSASTCLEVLPILLCTSDRIVKNGIVR